MSNNPLTFRAPRTYAPSAFAAGVGSMLRRVLNINPASVGKSIALEIEQATGFFTFRLNAAYERVHYRPAHDKAAAQKDWENIKANFHRLQKQEKNEMPPLFPDYLQEESLLPVYTVASPFWGD